MFLITLLIPGVGAQGEVSETYTKVNDDIGILVNSSRSIIYAGNDVIFLEKSLEETKSVQNQMKILE